MHRFASNILKWIPILPIMTAKSTNLEDGYKTSQQIETYIERLYLSPLDFSLSQFKLFELDTGALGKEIAAHLDITLGQLVSEKFNDGECNIQILNSVRGHNVYLIKSFGQRKINDGIIELLLTVNTLKKVGAQNVTCIIPFFPYSEGVHMEVQSDGDFFTCFGADILKLLEDAGCNRVITFNSLMSYPKGFVNQCSFININAPDLFIGHLATKRLRDPVLVSSSLNTPNFNNIHIIKNGLKYLNLNCPISTFNSDQYVGEDLKGRDVILYSNLLRSGKTFIKQSKHLKQLGARYVYGCSFHSLCSGKQLINVINQSALKQFLTTNSLPHGHQYKRAKTISLSRLIAETITLFQEEKSLTQYRLERQKQKIESVQKMKKINKQDSSISDPVQLML